MQYSAPSDATHIREMLARLSLSQRAAAEELDVSARDMRAYCAGKTVPKVVMLALARLVDLQRRVELDSRKPGISMLTLKDEDPCADNAVTEARKTAEKIISNVPRFWTDECRWPPGRFEDSTSHPYRSDVTLQEVIADSMAVQHRLNERLRLYEEASQESRRENERLRSALAKIRFAGNGANATAIWMQKVAAHAMDPKQWPAPPDEPPK